MNAECPGRHGHAAELVGEVAAKLNTRLGEITESIRSVLASEIEELGEDQVLLELLAASIEGNVDTILHTLRHDIPIGRVDAPAAAVEYARRLAQRGIPVNSLVRAYRLGQDRLLDWILVEIAQRGEHSEHSHAAIRHVISSTFSYIDWVSQQIVAVYESELARWQADRDFARATRIREILAGKSVAPNKADAVLNYSLRQRHLGAIMWTSGAPVATALTQLERAVGTIAQQLSSTVGRPLFSARDATSASVWLPVATDLRHDDRGAVDAVLRAKVPGVHVAFGNAGTGIVGFRETHYQALRAHRVGLVGDNTGRRVIAFADAGVPTASVLASDIEETRLLVRMVLGSLAYDDPARERLRETLLCFLASGSNYTATAEQLAMHKNSVKYRISRAQEERAKPLGDDRMDVQLALIACRWLGRKVLLTADT